MRYYYYFDRQLFHVTEYDGDQIILAHGDCVRLLQIRKDMQEGDYFFWSGEMLFLDQWDYVEFDENDRKRAYHLQPEDTPMIDPVLERYIDKYPLYQFDFETEERRQNIVRRRTWRVKRILNKDITGMYKLILEEKGEGNQKDDWHATMHYYANAFVDLLKKHSIKQIQVA